MATKPDLTKLKHILVPSTIHFYYETTSDGVNVLRHVRVYQRTFQIPADGVTIDKVPLNSVGSEELKDGSVGKVDVDDEVKEGLDELNNVGIEDKDIEDIFFPDGDVPDDADTEQNG